MIGFDFCFDFINLIIFEFFKNRENKKIKNEEFKYCLEIKNNKFEFSNFTGLSFDFILKL